MQIQRLIAPITGIFQRKNMKSALKKPSHYEGLVVENQIPANVHVYGFAKGPNANEMIVGTGNPATAEGSVFVGKAGQWKQVSLPNETALLNQFIKLPSGKYVAGGMNSIGRAAILLGDKNAENWTCPSIDLHPYSSIAAMAYLNDGSILASAGQMITQGKTRPVLFRSKDEGVTWEKVELKLPISLFQSFYVSNDGTVYAGTSGDKDPKMYLSKDHGNTWEEMPAFPGYKTYKMISVHMHADGLPGEKLFVVLWGYKTDIADRVVRIYVSNAANAGWEELDPIDDSHFVFSFLAASDGSFYIGSEKGRVYQSKDLGKSWEKKADFSTNIGAYALYEDESRKIWIGKDAVPPFEHSLWRTE